MKAGSRATDGKTNDRFRNRFRGPRDGWTGRYTAHDTDAHDAEEDPNSEEEESCEEESDLTAAFEREMDDLASVVEELDDTLGVPAVEDLRERSESMCEGLATLKETHAKVEGENEESRLPAFFVSLFSHSFPFATVICERHWPREKKETRPKGGSVHHKKLVTRRSDCNLLAFLRVIAL